jgi:hypothetical protein
LLAGRVAIAKAAKALDVNEAHLSCMLELVAFFAGPEAKELFEPKDEAIHLHGICTVLFVQLLGRHMFEPSSQDHWPAFQGANEAAVEQIETSKATLSRARPSSSKAGASMALLCSLSVLLAGALLA